MVGFDLVHVGIDRTPTSSEYLGHDSLVILRGGDELAVAEILAEQPNENSHLAFGKPPAWGGFPSSSSMDL